MRGLLGAILTAAALVAVVTGCGGAHRYDGRLVAADSLMHDRPDSALALVQAVSADSLTGEADRAYRDLLLTQARYRCYVTATSDSDINRALAYYRTHDGEREKLTRCYIYKGAVMEELGHPDSAMYYYKHAEATAAPDDYFNLGYSNMRMGELYLSSYSNDSAASSKMRNAEHYFTRIKDTTYLITAIGTQGLCIYSIDKESTRDCLERAINLARKINSPERFRYQSKLAGYYFYKQDYIRSKELSMDIIKHGCNEPAEHQYYYYAARSYLRMSLKDSALWVLSVMPTPITAVDSMNFFRLKAEIAESNHDYKNQGICLMRAKALNDRLLVKAMNSKMAQKELEIDTQAQHRAMKSRLAHRMSCAIGILLLLLFAILLIARKRINDRLRRYHHEIECANIALRDAIKAYEDQIAQQELEHKSIIDNKDHQLTEIYKINDELKSRQVNTYQQISDFIKIRKAALNELYQEIRIKSNSSRTQKKYPVPLMGMIKDLNDQKQLLNFTPKESFWTKLIASVDIEYRGFASFVQKHYPELTAKEWHLFLLSCADISPQIIKLCLGYDHVVTVSNYKRKLVYKCIGIKVSFDDFIQLYLDGKLG